MLFGGVLAGELWGCVVEHGPSLFRDPACAGQAGAGGCEGA